MEYLQEVGLGLGGLLFLMMFFRAVQTRWPESYFSIKDVTSYKISTSPWRYCLFRFGPVVLASFVVGVVATEIGQSAARSISVMLVVHIVLSSGWATAAILRKPPSEFAREVRLVIYLILSVGIVLSGLVGWLLTFVDFLRVLIPQAPDLTDALWTAGLAGVVGAFLIVISRGKAPDPSEVLRRSRLTIGESIWELIEAEANRFGADLALVQAVALVENLQRPQWIRSLERVKGKVSPNGTYGLMQVTATEPLSDEESVTIAIEHWFQGTRTGTYLEDLEDVLGRYNPDPTFRDLATSFYFELASELSYDVDYEDEEPFEISGAEALVGAGVAAAAGAIVAYLIAKRRIHHQES